ncbi:MAG: hypothetical protein QXO22_08060 [Thermosphaera sp.]
MREALVPFTIKVPLSVYEKYSRELSKEQASLVRDALRQFMTHLILNISNVTNVSNVSVSTNNNTNINVVLNINNMQTVSRDEKEEADVFTAERIKQLKQKLKEAQEVLKEYKVKAQKYDKIQHYVKLYRQGTIDVKTLINTILQEG